MMCMVLCVFAVSTRHFYVCKRISSLNIDSLSSRARCSCLPFTTHRTPPPPAAEDRRACYLAELAPRHLAGAYADYYGKTETGEDGEGEEGGDAAGGSQEVTGVDQETKENVPLKKKRGRKRIMPFWSKPSAPVVLPDMFR